MPCLDVFSVVETNCPLFHKYYLYWPTACFKRVESFVHYKQVKAIKGLTLCTLLHPYAVRFKTFSSLHVAFNKIILVSKIYFPKFHWPSGIQGFSNGLIMLKLWEINEDFCFTFVTAALTVLSFPLQNVG